MGTMSILCRLTVVVLLLVVIAAGRKVDYDLDNLAGIGKIPMKKMTLDDGDVTHGNRGIEQKTAERFAKRMMKREAMMQEKVTFWETHAARKAEFPTIVNSPAKCDASTKTAIVNGRPYDCLNIDFVSAVGTTDLKYYRQTFPGDGLFEMSDIWGWKSPNTGHEYTLAGMSNGLWIIDSTDILNPIRVGFIESPRSENYWDDVKVYKNVAYIVQDGANNPVNQGIQVFDLTRLDALINEYPSESYEFKKFIVDFNYTQHGRSHNLVMNTDTGHLYSVGSSGGTSCNGGLHIVSLEDPLVPTFVGCAAQDGYVHDAQCVIYTGPDVRYQSHEICFAFDEDALTIFDVSNMTIFRNNPGNVLEASIIGTVSYPTATYTHQGWLNKDMDFLLLDDELDEYDDVISNTRTYVFNVTDLSLPALNGHFDHPVDSIDHNLYFWGVIHANNWTGSTGSANVSGINGNIAYLANYASGLRVLDARGMSLSPPVLNQIGYFDVSPDYNSSHDWYGTWSSYMHPSGIIAVTVIESGVFFLNFSHTFGSNAEIEELVQSINAPDVTSSPTAPDPTTSSPTAPDPTTSSPTAPDPTTSSPTAPDPTTSSPTALDPTTSSPTAPDPTTSSPTAPDLPTSNPSAPSGSNDATDPGGLSFFGSNRLLDITFTSLGVGFVGFVFTVLVAQFVIKAMRQRKIQNANDKQETISV